MRRRPGATGKRDKLTGKAADGVVATGTDRGGPTAWLRPLRRRRGDAGRRLRSAARVARPRLRRRDDLPRRRTAPRPALDPADGAVGRDGGDELRAARGGTGGVSAFAERKHADTP